MHIKINLKIHIYETNRSSVFSAQGQVLHCKCRNLGCSSAEGRSSIANSGTKAIYQGLNRCGSFPLLSASNSVFSIWTDLKRFEKIPGAPTWTWGEWIWLTEPSGLHRNSPQWLNNSSIRVFDKIRDPESQSPFVPTNRSVDFNFSFSLFLLCRIHNRIKGTGTPHILSRF